MYRTGQTYRPIIRGLITVFLIFSVVGAAMADEREEQLRQDAYNKIMNLVLRGTVTGGFGGEANPKVGSKGTAYRKNRDFKVLSSCIYWTGNSVEELRTGFWGYSYNPSAFMGELRRFELNICKSKSKGKGLKCECQIVDENDKNKLKLPKKWKARVLALSKPLRDKPDKDLKAETQADNLYGALAVVGGQGRRYNGYGTGSSLSAARSAAFKKCAKHSCRVVRDYSKDECAYIVLGRSQIYWNLKGPPETPESVIMRHCKKNDKDCKLLVSECF